MNNKNSKWMNLQRDNLLSDLMWLLGSKLKTKLILYIEIYNIIPVTDMVRQHDIVESLLVLEDQFEQQSAIYWVVSSKCLKLAESQFFHL